MFPRPLTHLWEVLSPDGTPSSTAGRTKAAKPWIRVSSGPGTEGGRGYSGDDGAGAGSQKPRGIRTCHQILAWSDRIRVGRDRLNRLLTGCSTGSSFRIGMRSAKGEEDCHDSNRDGRQRRPATCSHETLPSECRSFELVPNGSVPRMCSSMAAQCVEKRPSSG